MRAELQPALGVGDTLVSPAKPGQLQRRLLRLKCAADFLSISPGALRRLIQLGEIPIVKLGDHTPWLLDIKDLEQFIERRKETFRW